MIYPTKAVFPDMLKQRLGRGVTFRSILAHPGGMDTSLLHRWMADCPNRERGDRFTTA